MERVPGELHNADFTVNELVHASVNARGYGMTKRDEAVPKFRFLANHPDGEAWVRKDAATVSGEDEMGGPMLKRQAALEALEAVLWGFLPPGEAVQDTE